MEEEKQAKKALNIPTSLLNKLIKETVGENVIVSGKFKEKLSKSILAFCYCLLDRYLKIINFLKLWRNISRMW